MICPLRAQPLRIEYSGTSITSPAGGTKRSKRRWRDRQDHAEKEGDANKIDLTLRLYRMSSRFIGLLRSVRTSVGRSGSTTSS